MIPAPIVQPSRALSSSNSHHSPTAVIGSFDGAAGLWKNEIELQNNIPSIAARRSCESVIALVKSLDINMHIQRFNRRNGFSFIVKGLKIGEIRNGSGGFILLLIKNMKVSGSTRPRQVKNKFIFTGLEKNPISDSELRNHFISEANNLISLRKNNTIGYREKWLLSLLIEKMQDGSLPVLDLEFLYYETPVGKSGETNSSGESISIFLRRRGAAKRGS